MMNLDPFWRTSVGFDRLLDLMDESLRYEPEDHYPPCNIVRTGEDKYRISLAVAGFKPEQISVTVHQNTLTIAGRTNEKQGEAEYLYRGIAGRPFERRFNLADYVEVKRRLVRGRAAPSRVGARSARVDEASQDRGPARDQLSGDKTKTIEHSKVA
jgi:HSP20 family molecular chaperone IbpA